MCTLQLYNDGDYIKVTDLFAYPAFVNEEIFRDQIAKGNRIAWNRAGETRIFPNAIIKDVLQVYDTWKNAPPQWTYRVPPSVGKLFFDQGLAIDHLGHE